MKATIYILLTLLLFDLNTKAQEITTIPDPEFEQILIDKGVDSDGEINGQVLTSDIENLTELEIIVDGWPEIYDLTGLQNFIALEHLILKGLEIEELDLQELVHLNYLDVNGTYIEELNLDNLADLKHLNCQDNMLTTLDVSNNPQLTYLNINSGGDVEPMNFIEAIDLSNNPDIDTLYAGGGFIREINLHNTNNNPDMFLNISLNGPNNGPPETWPHVCIEVDDPEAAENNVLPYSEWIFHHLSVNYDFTDDLDECVLGVDGMQKPKITFYPNPAENIIHFENIDRPYELQLYDLSGKMLLEQKVNRTSATANISRLSSGLYFYKLKSEKGIMKYGRLVKK